MAYDDRKKVPKYKGHTYGNFAQSAAYRDDQMEYYGLDRIDNGEEISGRGGYDIEAEEKAILNAMNNDYDLREAMKYGKNSGDKRFKDFESTGFKDLHEASLGQRAAQKYGMNELDINKVNKRDEYASVSDALFQGDRSKFGEGFATRDDLAEQTSTAITPDEPYTPSKELTEAKERVQSWESDTNQGTNPSPYGPAGSKIDFSSQVYGANSNRDASGEPANGEQAQGQLAKFKTDLKDRKNFQPTL